MDLIFFDLDGTLLNKSSRLSPFTRETLDLLNERGIAHTIATGRTMMSAQQVIGDHQFNLPHIYSNGVTTWDPSSKQITLENVLAVDEIEAVLNSAQEQGITPFINAIDSTKDSCEHLIFHPTPKHSVEHTLIDNYLRRPNAKLMPLKAFEQRIPVTNISMIGESEIITALQAELNANESLIAYSGPAVEGGNFCWMDVHHRLANKGSAVDSVKTKLGASNVICFGDSDNDLSMFMLADECYAPMNAKPEIKAQANAVIDHHNDDGVAHFLRERFAL